MKNTIMNIILSLQGRDVFWEYRELKKHEYNSLEQNMILQEERLKKLLVHAYKNVPYYTRVLQESGVYCNNEIHLEKFSKIPILTKDIIRKEFENLKSRDLGKRKWYYNTSGGSTGEPVRFIQDNRFWTMSMAEKWFYYSFITDKIPPRHVKLWGSERDILQGGYGFTGNLKNWIYSRKILNAFKMSPADMDQYIIDINSYKPVLIEAYVQSMYELAKYIRDNELSVVSPGGIITSAGVLYPEMKKLIEEVFDCRVYNRYGSREVGDIACSCEKDEGLHINIFNHYIEILDNNLESCSPGESGKVYVTTLNNYAMPLIRYDIGDMAVSSIEEKCSCSRGLPVIKDVVGRTNAIIRTPKGVFSGGITTSFYPYKSINKYQLIQKTETYFQLRLIVNEIKLWEMEKNDLDGRLKQLLGNDIHIEYIIEDDIKPHPNGKYCYIISEVS